MLPTDPTYKPGTRNNHCSPGGVFLVAPEISGPLRCWCAVSQDAGVGLMMPEKPRSTLVGWVRALLYYLP